MKHVASGNVQAQLLGLSTLVQLIKRARHAETAAELQFAIVNETHALVPYRQAALWLGTARRSGRAVAISGTPVVERNAPFTVWLNRALAKLDSDAEAPPRPVGAADLGGALGEQWSEWLPAHGLWVPLDVGSSRWHGGILFAREQPWSDADAHLLQELGDAYAYAWERFVGRRRRALFAGLVRRRTLVKLVLLAAVAAAMWIPITLSALAPAEVVPFKPTIVRAPLEGVVDHFAVQPSEPVKEGQLLLELDRRTIVNRLEIANQALAVAEAEYRQAAQQALFDDKSRAQLAVLKGRMDQRRAEASYTQSLLDRIQVTATRSGIAVFDDPNDWVGKPVTLGERLLEIADPGQTEVEIWLPVADAITLQPGAAIDFFINVAPDAPLHAKLRQASYEATLSPAGVLGYRLKAELVDRTKSPRIGLRGTAKLYGDRVTLFYYLMRRPLAAIRQILGM